MTYTELKARQSNEFSVFPIMFAFSDKQFSEGLEKLGAAVADICNVGSGGFVKKTDLDALEALMDRHTEEMRAAMQNDEFLIDALRYELSNHEFGLTHDPSEALAALELELDDDRKKRCFEIARNQYLEEFERYNRGAE